MNTGTMKLIAASAGAGAVISMAGLAVAGNSAAEPAPPGPVQVSQEPTMGETSTEALAPETPLTASAAPQITGPAPLPTEEQGLPG